MMTYLIGVFFNADCGMILYQLCYFPWISSPKHILINYK